MRKIMQNAEFRDPQAETFKIKYYPLGDWRLREVTDIDYNGVWEQTVLKDVPMAEIFDRVTIGKLSRLKKSL